MTCSSAECVCAKKSTCSCGARPAQQCNCDKATVENVAPAAGDACVCGKRNKDACTCGSHSHCDGHREGETDFTNLK
ncbi:copper resistance determinant 2 [Spathaspora passalidarum NRRL Y-27907]|uniref:Copper resistance determinant 2 n=1 Tax=Spathaspora passalidarum (strain NRRL Y-27907 / 11-Y1) TaxID=619300 RepID=G3ASW9_SPAPN|nr:copper resistance determinant 2 [Spathaspora passalidarum NRRL Y-27907]EGW30752.1 copper resistance determinant 2 [Spathaspora passalidarum NRRL Y-27907]